MATPPDSQAPMEPGLRPSSSVLESVELCRLFVGGLNPKTNEFSLRGHFEAFGSLTNCIVAINPYTRRSRCFGFITFSRVHEADRALAASPHSVDGNQVELKRALAWENSSKPGARSRVKKIFVGGLTDDLGESDLMRHFSQFGPVQRAEIVIHKQSGKRRGFGFVHFLDHDIADRAAVVKFQSIEGHRVVVKKALPKKDLDPRSLDLGSSRTRRPSNRPHAGLSSSRSPDPSSKPNVDPSPTPSLNFIPKPAECPGPKSPENPDTKPSGALPLDLIGVMPPNQ
ncbi:heterogeneous nuclear ribonucleoprotein A0-like [Trichosurus vulpecula]|uniref:heterogeneous nuclear ribonucleoprotein A0-like n=1 Tax=Trichosurus vulpecula TaxID=9337 RepID=UPI00186ADE01|nr:heterogeneous nuclear ribonucleoprotein A0-like [Trichosurus vulpecula]XP_036595928.1 heterogeneous nuclear ribonucleoprotein A0-like [Trichosurus vulpecula]